MSQQPSSGSKSQKGLVKNLAEVKRRKTESAVAKDSKSELDRYLTEEIEGDEAYFKNGDFTVLVDVAVNLEENIDDLKKFEDGNLLFP
nr:zinc finger BED domain-containing protein RICESLEEPER 1 [Tanacetum cinerariifolium]